MSAFAAAGCGALERSRWPRTEGPVLLGSLFHEYEKSSPELRREMAPISETSAGSRAKSLSDDRCENGVLEQVWISDREVPEQSGRHAEVDADSFAFGVRPHIAARIAGVTKSGQRG